MRKGSSNLTVLNLRSELDTFARETLQREFASLRDHIDKTVKRELQLASSKRVACRANSAEDLASDWGRSSSQAAEDTAVPSTAVQAEAVDCLPAGRRSTLTALAPEPLSRKTQAGWAAHRAGFSVPDDDAAASFGRARISTRRTRRQVGHDLQDASLSYTPLCKEDTAHSTEVSSSGAMLLPSDERGMATLDEAPDEDQDDAGSRRSGLGSRDMVISVGEKTTRPSCCTRMCQSAENIVMSEHFDYFIGGVIMLNALVIGMETEYMASTWSTDIPTGFRMIDRTFCAIFLLELILRFCVSGLAFFHEPGWKWNVFDLLVVTLQVFDEMLGFLTHNIKSAEGLKGAAANQLRTMRILRLFRLVRLLRLTRMLYLLGGLRMLVVSITDSLRSLAWTLFLLFGLTFVFAVFLTQLVTDFKVQHTSEEDREKMEELLYFFGSLDRSMLCLYETISEGNHWHEVVKPLMEQCGRWLALVFIIYMSFTLFALMNVVTGVFCESAIRTAEEDKKQVLMQQMQELFLEADDDGNGTVSAEEFEAHLKDPQMLMYLKAIDVNPEEARHLFALLDTEERGEIEAEALVNGCLRLQGSAKAIELAAFIQDHKSGYQRLMAHADLVERSLSFLCDNVSQKETEMNVQRITCHRGEADP